MIFIDIIMIIMLAIPIIGAISSIIGNRKPEYTELIYEIKKNTKCFHKWKYSIKSGDMWKTCNICDKSYNFSKKVRNYIAEE